MDSMFSLLQKLSSLFGFLMLLLEKVVLVLLLDVGVHADGCNDGWFSSTISILELLLLTLS